MEKEIKTIPCPICVGKGKFTTSAHIADMVREIVGRARGKSVSDGTTLEALCMAYEAEEHSGDIGD